MPPEWLFCAANEQKAIAALKCNCHRQGQLQNLNSSLTSKIPHYQSCSNRPLLYTHLISDDGVMTIASHRTQRLSAIYDSTTFQLSTTTTNCSFSHHYFDPSISTLIHSSVNQINFRLITQIVDRF